MKISLQNLFFLICMGALLGACASTPKLSAQTEALLQESTLPRTQEIANVPFIEQSVNYCGPATLAMVISQKKTQRDTAVTMNTLASQMYTPGKKGSLKADMIGATRRQGFQALVINSMPALLEEVAAGNPVIVLENLGLSWYPKWHYAVVFGYDLPSRTLTMHSGPEAFKKESIARFEREWALADHWALLVLPPEQLSQTASELQHAEAAATFEQMEQYSQAEEIYRQILKRWPKSLIGHIGLANTLYAKNDFKGAALWLSQAARLHPENEAVRLNLATVNETLKQNSAELRGKIPH